MSFVGSSGLFEAPPTDDEEEWGSGSQTVTAVTASSDRSRAQYGDDLGIPNTPIEGLSTSYDMERTTAVDPMIAFERNMKFYTEHHSQDIQNPEREVSQDERDCEEEVNQVTISISNTAGHDLKPMTYIAFIGSVGLGIYVDNKRIGTSTKLTFNSDTKVLRDQNGLGGYLTTDSTDDDIQKLASLADLAQVNHNLGCTVAWGNTEIKPIERCRMTYKTAWDRLHLNGMFVKQEQQIKREAVQRAIRTHEINDSNMAQRRVRVKCLNINTMENIFRESKVSLTKMKKKRIFASDSDPCKTGFIIPEEDLTGSVDVSDDGYNELDESSNQQHISPAVFIQFLDGCVYERWPRSAVSLLTKKPRNTNFSVIEKKTHSSENRSNAKKEQTSVGRSRLFTINGSPSPRR